MDLKELTSGMSLVEKIVVLQELAHDVVIDARKVQSSLPATNYRLWQFFEDHFGKGSDLAQMTKDYGGSSLAHKVEMLKYFNTGMKREKK